MPGGGEMPSSDHGRRLEEASCGSRNDFDIRLRPAQGLVPTVARNIKESLEHLDVVGTVVGDEHSLSHGAMKPTLAR